MADRGGIEYQGAPPVTNVDTILVHCGSISNYVAVDARTFVADYNFSGGEVATKTGDVLYTTDDPLYLTFRRLPTSQSVLNWTFTNLINGEYLVKLHFMESFWTENTRAFNYDIQGNRIETDFEVFTESGGYFSALIKTHSASVTNNTLSISFTHGSGTLINGSGQSDTKPEIMGIEIIPDPAAGAGDPAGAETLPLRVSSGGAPSSFVTDAGDSFETDRNFNGSTTVLSTADPISGTIDDGLYQKGRRCLNNNDVWNYTFTVPTGSHQLKLYFCETFYTGVGQRVFDIAVNGVVVEDNLDVWGEVGHDAALIKTYNITTINEADNLVIEIDGRTASGGTEKGVLMALELLSTSSAPANPPGNPSEIIDSATQITVDHDAVTDATGYDYEIRLPNDTLVDSGSEATPGHVFLGLTEYTAYKWRARGTNTAGAGPWGSYRNVITADETAPTVPTNNSAVEIPSSGVSVSSDGSTDTGSGVSYYWLRETGSQFPDTEVYSFPFDLTGLPVFVTLTMTLSAVDAYGNESAQSASFESETGGIPDTPLNPSAVPASETSLSIMWDTAPGATSYLLYHVPPTVGFDTLIVEQAGVAYTHTGLNSWETHHYKVSAKNASGESAKSESFSGRTDDTTAPAGGSINTAEQQGATVVFDITPATDAGSGLAGYNLLNNSVQYDIITDAAPQTDISYTGATYSWTLQPFDVAGNVGTESASVELVVLSTYPDYAQSYDNDREPLENVAWDRANGKLRGRVLHQEENYDITITHPYITDAERQILNGFWDQNIGALIQLVIQDTGEAYQCYMQQRPKFIPLTYDGSEHSFKAIVKFIK